MSRVVVLEEATQDLEAARDFYDASELGIGSYFFDAMISDLESLSLFHGIHSLHFGYHRMLASRFPFGIYYAETAQETQVIAILDLRRDPSWIHHEIQKRNC